MTQKPARRKGAAPVTVRGASSSQPATGSGQGNQSPDVILGPGAVCLRSERQGTSKAGRTYTITIGARDASGNETLRDVAVQVNHDASGGCGKVPSSRLVDDGDPRCVEAAP